MQVKCAQLRGRKLLVNIVALCCSINMFGYLFYNGVPATVIYTYRLNDTQPYPALAPEVVSAVTMLRKSHLRGIQEYQDYNGAETETVSRGTWIARRNGFILNENPCTAGDTLLVVVVSSAVYRFEQRKVIRRTWGSITKDPSLRTKLVFMLAVHPDPNMQKYVVEESHTHHDIIQDNFTDSYQNLTMKSISMLRWFQDSCSSVQYLLKADDDMYINIPNLLKDLAFRESFVPIRNTIMGHVQENARPDLDPQSKWYTPKEVYSNKTYPTYCSGTAYLLSNDIIRKLYNASKTTPIFWLEDVYITGILAQKIQAKLVQNNGFNYIRREKDPCIYRTVITGHRVNAIDLEKIWTGVNNKTLTCDNYNIPTNVKLFPEQSVT